MQERLDPTMELDTSQLWYLFERKKALGLLDGVQCELCEGSHGNNTDCQRNDLYD